VLTAEQLMAESQSCEHWFLVEVTGEHCAPCRAVEQLLLLLEPSLDSRCSIVQVRSEASPEWVSDCQIRTVPLLLLYHRGQEVGREQKNLSIAGIRHFLKDHLPFPVEPQVGVLLKEGRLDQLRAVLDLMTDEESRTPEVQRARSWLSMRDLELYGPEASLRDSFFEEVRAGDWERVLGSLEVAASTEGLRDLTIALADLIPERKLVAQWRRKVT
jgi:thioredoxin-like negative regulator of GroEL